MSNNNFEVKKGIKTPLTLTIPMSQSGAPTTGTWEKGTSVKDVNGISWDCITSGTPGEWQSFDTKYDGLPVQTDNENKFLKTDGSSESWEFVTGNDIPYPQLGNTVEAQNVLRFLELLVSPNTVSGFDYTTDITGNITFSAGDALLKTTANDDAPLVNCRIEETVINIPDGATYFIYCDYNSGTPIITATASPLTINFNSQSPMAVANRVGEYINIADGRESYVNGFNKLSRKTLGSYGYEHMDGSGLYVPLTMTGDQGGLFIYLSQGANYLITNMITHRDFNTLTTDRFYEVYGINSSNTYTRTANNKQMLDNVYYVDDSGVLVEMDADHYNIHLLYVTIDSTNPRIFVWRPCGQFRTPAEVYAWQIPDYRPDINQFRPSECVPYAPSVFVAKIIVQKNASVIFDKQEYKTKAFVSNKAITHDGLAGLNDNNKYLHVTDTEKALLHSQNTDTETNSDSYSIGDGTDSNNKLLYANIGETNNPNIRFNITNNKWEFSDDGTAYNNINQLISQKNIKHVDKNGNDSVADGTINKPFLTINAALASIIDNSIVNGYVIKIAPGIYIEPPLIMKTNVDIEGCGNNNTLIMCSSTTGTAITGIHNCNIINIGITGTTGVGGCLVKYNGSAEYQPMSFTAVYFGDTSTVCVADGSTGTGTLFLLQCAFGPNWTNKCFDIIGGSVNAPMQLVVSNSVIPHTNVVGTPVFADVRGPGSQFSMATSQSINYIGNGIGIKISNGASIQMSGGGITGYDRGIYVDDQGVGSNVKFLGDLDNTTYEYYIDNPLTTGTHIGNADYTKIYIDPASTFNMSFSGGGTAGQVVLQSILQGDRYDRLMNLSKLVRDTASLGLFSGGEISLPGDLDITITAGNGFLLDATDLFIKEVSWNESTITLAASSEQYVYINTAGVFSSSVPHPNGLASIMIARVMTDADKICMATYTPMYAKYYASNVENTFRNILGGIFGTGCIVSENTTTDLSIDISGGKYYYGTRIFEPSDATGATFEIYYRNGSGGYNNLDNQTLIPVQYDDNSGTLQNPTPTYYVKHSVYLNGDGALQRHFVIIGQNQYSSIQEVQAAPNPIPPTHIKNSIVLIATIIVRQGVVNIVEIDNNVKPKIGGTVTGGTGGGVTAHGDLTGLSNDDHTLYLKTDGTRSMSGSLNMGTYNITNVGNVDGVDISSHESRHLPNGSDPITTAAPSVNLTNITTNSVGIANSLARSDHSHAITTANISAGSTKISISGGTNAAFSATSVDINEANLTHNNIGSLQGGTTSEYYHLSQAKYNIANGSEQSFTTTLKNLYDGYNNDRTITKDPTGFTSPEDVIVSYDSGTKKITLTGTVVAYYRGILIPSLISGWVSDAISGTPTQPYYLYYNGTAFVWDTNQWSFDSLQIAYVYYTAGGLFVFAQREPHGFMPWQCHLTDHYNLGTAVSSGGDLSNFTPGSTTPANRRPDVSQSTLYDEDLPSTLLTKTDKLYSHFFLSSTNTPNFTIDASELVSVTGARPNWNQLTGGNWVQTPMSNNSYMCIWVAAIPVTADVNSQKVRYLYIQGQSNTTSLTTQQGLTTASLNISGLSNIAPEFVFIAKIIIQYTTTDWNINSITKITGNRSLQISSPSGNYLSIVTTDTSLTGDGTAASPLSVNPVFLDSTFKITDNTTPSKAFQFEANLISISTTRVITVPDRSLTLDNITTSTTTNITGILKGNGTVISAASAGTDYQAPLTNPVTGTGTSGQIAFFNGTSTISSDSDFVWDSTNNRLGITTTPTAHLHLPAGTATANTAPLKLNTGTALTNPEDGAIEYHSSHLYFTISSTRYQLDQQVPSWVLTQTRIYVRGSGTAINLTAGQDTKITYNTEDVDSQNEFDPNTNYRFTVTNTGRYLITAKVEWKTPTTTYGENRELIIKKNGSTVESIVNYHSSDSSLDITQEINTQIQLTANDYVEVFANATDDTQIFRVSKTNFAVTRIG